MLTDLLYRLRAIFGRRRMESDIDEEVRFHFEQQVAKNVRQGMPQQEARRQARLTFGGIHEVKEECRDARGICFLETTVRDLRYALRGLRKSRGFAAIAILSFALGISLNTAIFSVVHSVLLKPLPYPDSERIVWFGEATATAKGISVSWVNFQNWVASNRSFDRLVAYQSTQQTLTGRAEPLVTRGLLTTASYFDLLGMQPAQGRFFSAEEDRPGAKPVVVLNHRFWSRQLGGDEGIVGSAITLGGASYQVIGIAAPLWQPWSVDYYLSISRVKGSTTDRRQHDSMRVLGLLKPGVSLTDAHSDLDSILIHLAEVDPGPENEHRSFGSSLAENSTGEIRGALLLLMAASALVLLIASANIASMVLARNTSRAGEFALRAAIGASRLRVVRQLLTEHLILASAGGIAGVLLAIWALRVLIAAAPQDVPHLAETAVEPRVLLFACAATLAAGVIAGLAPVLFGDRVQLTDELKEGSRGAGSSRGRQGSRNVLVIAEVALTVVLALGSGLLVQSLITAQQTRPGFDSRDVLSFSVQLPPTSYAELETRRSFYERLLGQLNTTPGIISASAARCAPGAGTCGDWFYSVPGKATPAESEVPLSLFNGALPGYFEMMKIPLLQGREFEPADATRDLAVINETLARTWWPNETALGSQIKVGGPYQEGELLEIIGVVGDVKQYGLDSEVLPEIYTPSDGDRSMFVLVRGSPALAGLPALIRSQLAAIDRDLPPNRLAKFDEAYDAGLSRRRFITLLLTLFAVLAMALSAVGVYGLLNYWVTCRESEIAVRLALGARPAMIWRWSALQAFRLAAVGVFLGLAGGWVAARGLDDLVFGTSARDPLMMAAAALAVLMVAALAAAIPSWRASRINAARRLQGA